MPYRTTSYQGGKTVAEASLKRYRYTGKERDEETGLYYHGARYYAPWLARWCAADPLQSDMPTWSSYNYGFCNPITWADPTGMFPGNTDDGGGNEGPVIEETLQRSQENFEKAEQLFSDAMKDADPVAAFGSYAENLDQVVAGLIETGGELYNTIENLPELLNQAEAFIREVGEPILLGDMDAAGSKTALAGAELIESASQAILALSQDLSAAMNGDAKALGRLLGEAIPILLTEGLSNYMKGRNMIRGAKEMSLKNSTFSPIKPGPLKSEIANTFRSATYTEGVASEPITLYRSYGGEAKELSVFWTRTKPTGSTQAAIDMALDRNWGNTATKTSSITIPKGTVFYEGAAVRQGNLLGGGNQIYIPIVKSQWLNK